MDVEDLAPRRFDRGNEAGDQALVAPLGDVWYCYDPCHAREFSCWPVLTLRYRIGVTSEHGFSVRVAEGYDEAVTRTRLALRGEGFSIITEADVGGMLGPRTSSERQYLFMGAWDAAAAQRDLGGGLEVATHLPCNVVVHEVGSDAMVATLDPREDADAADPSQMETAEVAVQALWRVLERVATPS